MPSGKEVKIPKKITVFPVVVKDVPWETQSDATDYSACTASTGVGGVASKSVKNCVINKGRKGTKQEKKQGKKSRSKSKRIDEKLPNTASAASVRLPEGSLSTCKPSIPNYALQGKEKMI
jgi:hypothetical protein